MIESWFRPTFCLKNWFCSAGIERERFRWQKSWNFRSSHHSTVALNETVKKQKTYLIIWKCDTIIISISGMEHLGYTGHILLKWQRLYNSKFSLQTVLSMKVHLQGSLFGNCSLKNSGFRLQKRLITEPTFFPQSKNNQGNIPTMLPLKDLYFQRKVPTTGISSALIHSSQLGSIRPKQNIGWQHLSRM